MDAKFYQVPSFSDPNKKYTVRQLPDQSWHCDCPSFVFRQKPCDHIRKIRHQKMKLHGNDAIKSTLDKKE